MKIWGPGQLSRGGRKRAKNGPKYGVREKCQKSLKIDEKSLKINEMQNYDKNMKNLVKKHVFFC